MFNKYLVQSEKVEGEEKVEELNKEKKFVNIFSEKDTNVKLQKKKKIKGKHFILIFLTTPVDLLVCKLN